MKNAVIWEDTPCDSCKNRRFGHIASIIRVIRFGELGTNLIVTSNKVFLRCMCCLIVTANVVPSSPIHVTLMIKALRSSEASVITRDTRRNISENGILHGRRSENLKSYITLTGWGVGCDV
jgi:hypothetical protein